MNTYSVIVSYEDDKKTVHLAQSPDGHAMRALAEEVVRHAAPAISCVKVRAEGDRGPIATFFWWRGMRIV
jgi:hypothetical protein